MKRQRRPPAGPVLAFRAPTAPAAGQPSAGSHPRDYVLQRATRRLEQLATDQIQIVEIVIAAIARGAA